ncbi:peptidoglycan-binding protein [Gellertiella hungarica]|uniref:Peptidoglycan hydrolase-like protein with peptidoglycan-binding domain n=1 Tax=Gellertiella hungarica TaxID=1572859 RepID=A0A7W6NJT2_9HYPH|nr:peptidoglycan-binding protein [Gellertiella hungarica]MBB4063700.1 peptidoglycan hydrolase-like protein with peptidoglycan-binding domain [Gellertiella hungarica]
MTIEQWLQSRLTAHRFPVGLIDGQIGPVTIRAIKAFQTSHGLEPTGKADGHTVALLRAPASVVLPSPGETIPDRGAAPLVAAPANGWPRQSDCLSFFGPVGTSQTSIEIPFDMYLAWDKSTRVRKMAVHEKVAKSAEKALQDVAQTYTLVERAKIGIDIFGGSLNVRRMRGGTAYSMHSWGIAIDFDPERNQLKWGRDKARLAQDDAIPFWTIWEAEGWLSLGRSRNFDWMHVQAARL